LPKVVKSVKKVINGPKWAPKTPRVAKISKIVRIFQKYLKGTKKCVRN
jgi:hypothetical protein